MTEEVLPEGPVEEDSVHFQSKRGLAKGPIAGLFAFTLGSLLLLLSGWAGRPLWLWVVTFPLVLSSFFTVLNVLRLRRLLKGEGPGGLLVDNDGIVDRQGLMGRVAWDEIIEIYPFEFSFFGKSLDRHNIVLEVTDSLQRRLPRSQVPRAWNKSSHLALGTKNLEGSRDEILQVLQDGLLKHQLRSISEAKELESGSES